ASAFPVFPVSILPWVPPTDLFVTFIFCPSGLLLKAYHIETVRRKFSKSCLVLIFTLVPNSRPKPDGWDPISPTFVQVRFHGQCPIPSLGREMSAPSVNHLRVLS